MGADPSGILLAHLSDPHLPVPPGLVLRDIVNKRALSLLSWQRRRRHQHLRATLDRLTADLAVQAPDHVAVTGDLTNLGLASEFRCARAWLGSLGPEAAVSVIPGNHDALVRGAWQRGAGHWREFCSEDAAEGAAPEADVPEPVFPYLRRRGPLALIGISSAIATWPGQATGSVGPGQLARLAVLLARGRGAGLCRVVMIHHPPMEGTVAPRKRLCDAPDLRRVLAREGVELVLHGHSHRSHLQMLDTVDGMAPVIGVPAASAMQPEPAAYNLYRITPERRGWRLALSTRRLRPEMRPETSDTREIALGRAV